MKIEWRSCLKIGISIFGLYLCIHYWEAASEVITLCLQAATPLLIGCVIAYLVNILMGTYEKLYFPRAKKAALVKSRRPICMVLSFVTLILVIVLVVALVLPQFVSCIALLLDKLSQTCKELLAKVDTDSMLVTEILNYLGNLDWKSKLNEIVQTITSGFGDALETVIGIVTSLVGGAATAFIAIIFSAYLLMGKEKIIGQCRKLMNRWVKPSIMEKADYVLHTMNGCFRKYIVGQCTEAVILGVLCTLGMWILKLPYATMIGALIAFTALIPIAGAWIGAGVGAFMILTEDPIKAVIFLIFIVILQQVEGNIIYPKVVGSSIGLPAIWVLAAVTIGGGIAGIGGMLLGVPLAATAYRLLREDVRSHQAEIQSSPQNIEDEVVKHEQS